ncbi:MAG: 23S rRNA (pseudouridine(1915)-N(3))-methyltransferase RlmH [Candidatus Magasanikbacteria bacterium CG10_big_fil_rev_8_21_14_0_10_43_6]|uniref:Ribosomal RNA large subunit methyltransferase H n=1 Tax=Candidatus Magasanikbacteria bacterium CG10_big_fil_rev_8_21_14_0_10_43_6 TaxID=1974650 RepID=A0A2M6W260_9BACT|nr:MAG: 23S rRNA (pseudouridine(1915)-N(3))-methyltransferase RlmH [Candidatus Magasanikbacteria bacterium CG10_big_fil_rev_8_21_14_0_10_43_6]
MIHIRIIAIGKQKEQYWRDAEKAYTTRLSPYAKIDIIEIKEEAFQTTDVREHVREKEAEKIKKYLDGSGMVVALTESGTRMDSLAFSAWLTTRTATTGKITFLIGGPLGFHASILDAATITLSLSDLTFPHQMVRTLLLEQLYRAITIEKGKQYHY